MLKLVSEKKDDRIKSALLNALLKALKANCHRGHRAHRGKNNYLLFVSSFPRRLGIQNLIVDFPPEAYGNDGLAQEVV
jgi:hypothetical protein